MYYKHGWYDPDVSGFHSKSDKVGNKKLRDEAAALSKNFTGSDSYGEGNGWGASEAYADSVYGGGKYEHNLMNDEYLGHMIGYLKDNQKQAAPKPEPKPVPVPIKLSKTAAKAVGRAKAYEDTLMVRDGDYVIGGDESVIDDFNTQAKENIAQASKPKFDADVDPKIAQEYADKYKLMLGEDFSLTKIA